MSLRKMLVWSLTSPSLELRPPQGHHPAGCVRCGTQHHQRQPRIDTPQRGCFGGFCGDVSPRIDPPQQGCFWDVSLTSFCPEDFVGIGVPIGTDAFVHNVVVQTCMSIIDDVEKLDTIQDGFVHYQLLRFC